MSQNTRFGRKIALPSTRQIRHELIESMLKDERDQAVRDAAAGRAAAPSSPAPLTIPA